MSDQVRRPDNRRGATRSRSSPRHDQHAHRTRSPHRHRHRHKRSPVRPAVPKELPYGARQVTRRDFVVFRPMLALYLDIQKQKVLDDMDEVEAKGRWKSFMGKWNRAELAEGWYDPSTLQKAIASSSRAVDSRGGEIRPNNIIRMDQRPGMSDIDPGSESDDSVGPSLPGMESRSRVSRMGPSIPNMEDLELKREVDTEHALAAMEDMRAARKADRKLQKEALEELVPRPDAGTFERRLEKKASVNATMKSLRERSPGAAEVPETELMGGGDGMADFKKQKQEYEMKKTEREIRKEEVLRARAAEREERLQDYKVKEDKTMAMLKALAKERFG